MAEALEGFEAGVGRDMVIRVEGLARERSGRDGRMLAKARERRGGRWRWYWRLGRRGSAG